MKFLIAGAGAIGAYLGACMHRAGEDVTLFARGPHLRAMQANGVRVLSSEGDFETRPKIVERLEDAGPVDVIFLGVKAHSSDSARASDQTTAAREYHRGEHSRTGFLGGIFSWARANFRVFVLSASTQAE